MATMRNTKLTTAELFGYITKILVAVPECDEPFGGLVKDSIMTYREKNDMSLFPLRLYVSCGPMVSDCRGLSPGGRNLLSGTEEEEIETNCYEVYDIHLYPGENGARDMWMLSLIYKGDPAE